MYDYLKDIKEFNDEDLENAIFEYIKYHNNKKKSSTKFTPNEIRNINNEEQINLIIENMIKSSNKNITYFIF